MKKTIFISAYNPFIARNIFNTGVLGDLRKQTDLQIVLLVPADKKDFMEKYYGGDNIFVEARDFEEYINKNKFWYRLAFLLQNTRYVKDQRAERLWKNKNLFRYLNYWLVSLSALILSNLPLARKIYRNLDYHFSSQNAFSEFFEKHQPLLVFSTDIFGETDIFLIREARSRAIPIIGMVRSWDNPTTKGILRVIPEKIIVNSPVMKEELIKFHDCKEENILVAGYPQFDNWLNDQTLSRDDFFKKIGADPVKQLILFAPAGKVLSDTDWQLCQILKEALDDGSLSVNIQFLVRNHPHHPADLSMFKKDPRFIIEIPGMRNKDWSDKKVEYGPEENDHLKNSIYYSDIIMYVATTLGLDATVFNKPQIMVSFDGWESKSYVQSVRRYNREDCLQNLVRCGGTRVVKSKKEWIKSINEYLRDPSLDQAGRDKTVTEHLYRIDGKAGERIANFISEFIK
ncbi:MAG: CDP-glycerol glycerophosphotransferase family protein [Patescibacteria group bacterium]|mgnify:CR=1 FL=1